MKPNKTKLSRRKELSVERPVSSAKKKSRVESRESGANPSSHSAIRHKSSAAQQPPAIAAPPELAAQVAELQGQLAALRAAVEGRETSVESQERVQRPRSRASANPQPTPASSPVESSGYSTGPSHSPLHHAAAAQREGGPLPVTAAEQHPSTLGPRPSTQLAALSEQIAELRTQLASVATAAASAPVTSYSPPATAAEQPPSTPLAATPPPSPLDSGPSTRAGAKPMPIYELKETRPVGYQSSDLLDSSSEESEDGFFTGLLDRTRMQWLMGDWESLSKLDLEQIQHHPDRAKLALLVSAGLMQGGQAERAKQHLAQAYRWGVPKKLAFSILYSGVRQNLHQASNGTVSSGASLTNGAPGARPGVSGFGGDTTAILAKLSQLHETVESISPLLAPGVKTVSDELIRVRKNLDSAIEREVKNASRQIQASAAVQHYLGTGELLPFHPESDNMPITPDFAFTLVQLLETRDYDLIVEFGSGLSTVLVARCLEKINRKRQGKALVRFLSFDHLPEFHGYTLALLQQAGLAERVELCLAPLADYSAPNGLTYTYYSCQERLSAFADAQPLAELKILAIVDGPPQSTGKHARYPAGPILARAFSAATLDIFLDDFIREDERQIATLWEDEFRAAGRYCASRILKLQKKACILHIHN